MDVKLPKLGEGADAGVVVSIFVKDGDVIAKDQPILELESEKAVASVPSPAAGTVTQIHVKPGDKVSVGQRLLTLGEGAGAAATPQPEAPAPVAAPSPTPAPASEPAPVPAVEEAPVAGPPAAAPSVRLIAKELGIDLTRIRGSQRGGRIVMADLRAYIERLQQLAARATATAAAPLAGKPAKEPVDFSKWGPVTVKPLSPLRQVIARRMSESWAAVPRVTQFDDADVTRLLDLRKQHMAAYEAKGVRLTLTGFVVKALVGVLQKHPTFNASLDHTEENLVLKSYFHIGIAVDTEAGLMVPVIRDADKKSLVELSRELEDLARKARERKVSADDLKGGTFTITNQGGIGGAHFTPVVNLPEVAILGLGRGAVKPVWRDGKFEPRTLLPLGLSYDHRVIDGGSAARFIVDLVQAIEQFDDSLARI
ncbi:MAG: 2-oxo acid dehydrogenase subunit E2 [Verrucomicrobiota bacterium]|jgi:pyruvate dehydrogenase E2 component (dihydrolipoamide acetyltransferase)